MSLYVSPLHSGADALGLIHMVTSELQRGYVSTPTINRALIKTSLHF